MVSPTLLSWQFHLRFFLEKLESYLFDGNILFVSVKWNVLKHHQLIYFTTTKLQIKDKDKPFFDQDLAYFPLILSSNLSYCDFESNFVIVILIFLTKLLVHIGLHYQLSMSVINLKQKKMR